MREVRVGGQKAVAVSSWQWAVEKSAGSKKIEALMYY